MDPRFGGDPKHRPWPAMYRNHPGSRVSSFCYRPVAIEALPQWLGPMPPPPPDYNYLPRMPNKGRDYYYLAPLYRNAMPPPPPAAMQVPPMGMPPNRMVLMERPRGNRAKSSGQSAGHISSVASPPCTCIVGRTRSLEDVRSEMSEWEDYNNNVENDSRTPSSKNGMRNGRKSMENLLDVDVIDGDSICYETKDKMRCCKKPECYRKDRSSRRRGSYMVGFCWME